MHPAEELWALGWNVVPAPLKHKSPATSWKRWTTERQTERFVRDAFNNGPRNVFVICGVVSGLVVLDCDTEEALEYWRGVLGDELEQTAQVATRRGRHFYFRLAAGATSARSAKGEGWDLQADGKGVVAPPSLHESGFRYTWVEGRGPECLREAPPALFGGEGGSSPARSGDRPTEAPRSTLTWLLGHPPKEGGRNDWLARVAGHYAKRFQEEDLYDFHVRWAASTLQPPLPEEEVEKTARSIWQTEESKFPAAAPEESWRIVKPSQTTGWLASGGTSLMVQCKGEDGLHLEQVLNADLRALGVMREDGEVVYDVQVLDGSEPYADRLPSSVLADGRKIGAWLAAHRLHPLMPDRVLPRSGTLGVRLQAYLDAQKPSPFEVVGHLGWHRDTQSFITHEGVITADGHGPHERVKPTVGRDRANYTYGFGGRERARAVLREVLSFHDETVTAVFGAWWAAVFVKDQLMDHVSQFPFMAVEAPSESGKSTGFFSLMLELSGAKDANMQSTKASTRDFLASHGAGITWVDDLDDPAYLMELVRGSTSGASMSKKGIDHSSQVKVKLRGALVLSGEALGLGTQKALADRSILLHVPNPRGRESLRHPGKPQWDDILALKAKFPQLTDFAGEYVQMALAYVRDQGLGVTKLRRGTGRFADKQAILRYGARLLESISGAEVVERVDQWSAEQIDLGNENTLTMHVLPTAIRTLGSLEQPLGPLPEKHQVATPVLVRGGTVWFSPTLLADWWSKWNRGRVQVRTETLEALTQQARALGLGGTKGVDRKTIRYATGDGSSNYWRLDEELSYLVLTRASGEGDK